MITFTNDYVLFFMYYMELGGSAIPHHPSRDLEKTNKKYSAISCFGRTEIVIICILFLAHTQPICIPYRGMLNLWIRVDIISLAGGIN